MLFLQVQSECISLRKVLESNSPLVSHELTRSETAASTPSNETRVLLAVSPVLPLQPSFFLQVQYSTWMLYVPDLWMQYLSSFPTPGSPRKAQDLKYLHSPFTFCLIFLHIVAFSPGKCSFSALVRQSVMGKEVLSDGSAHLGSPSLRHSQHFME